MNSPYNRAMPTAHPVLNATPAYPKPQPSARGGRIAYRDLMAYLQNAHGLDLDDFYNQRAHYPSWCAKHNLPSNSPEISEKQRIFQEYNAAPDGAPAAPEHANFHDWLMDLHRGESTMYKTMSVMNLNVPKILTNYDSEKHAVVQKHEDRIAQLRAGTLGPNEPPVSLMPIAYGEGLPAFAQTILERLQAEFGNVVKLSFK